MLNPLVTIITATYNVVGTLPHTLRSIREQRYKNIQWLVIDGASKDGTVDLLKQNDDIIDYWISEPDQGVYDAWNKACLHVRGEWVLFIGAGDELASADVLEEISGILATAYPDHEIVYGRLLRISKKKRVVLEEVGEPWTDMKNKWECFQPALPVHPSVFHHRTLINGTRTFDIRFKIGADQHLLLQSIFRKDPLYVPIVIDKMPIGGVSTEPLNSLAVAREYWLINSELGISPPWSHAWSEYLRIYGKTLLGGVLPSRLLASCLDLYRRLTGRSRIWTID